MRKTVKFFLFVVLSLAGSKISYSICTLYWRFTNAVWGSSMRITILQTLLVMILEIAVAMLVGKAAVGQNYITINEFVLEKKRTK